MSLLYQPRWAEIAPRYAAWWKGRDIAGPLLAVTAPRAKPMAGATKPDQARIDPRRKWLDPDVRLEWAEWTFASTYYAGDAFPWFETHLGPGSLALHLGSPGEFDENTVWYLPIVTDIENPPPLPFDPRERYFQVCCELARRGMERFAGKALVAFPDLIENLDTIASLRGSMELLYDLVDRRHAVFRLQEIVLERYFQCYDAFEPLIRDRDGGTCFAAFHVWGPGRTCKLQCDMSAMIGPRLFEEVAAPYFERQCARVDNSVYHLDGPSAIKHLDTLCSMRGLKAIQWTPGAGFPDAGDPAWYPLYRKILASGKNALALGVPPEKVVPLLQAVGPRGMLIRSYAWSEREAEELVAEVKRMS